jgi:hypothetical protein
VIGIVVDALHPALLVDMHLLEDVAGQEGIAVGGHQHGGGPPELMDRGAGVIVDAGIGGEEDGVDIRLLHGQRELGHPFLQLLAGKWTNAVHRVVPWG